MSKTIEETESAKAETKLQTRILTNKAGEQTGKVFEAGLSSLKVDDLFNLFDALVLDENAQSIILGWHCGEDVPESAPKWIQKPNKSQAEVLTAPVFTPAAYKKQFAAIDLEHRKVTPDKKGKVAELVKVGEVWSAEQGKLVDKMGWNAAGETLFKAKDRSKVFNFVHRAISTLGLEDAYLKNLKQFAKEGYRTVEQKKNAKSVVHKMVAPEKIKSKTRMVGGRELTNEQADRAAAEYIKLNPDAFLVDTEQDNG